MRRSIRWRLSLHQVTVLSLAMLVVSVAGEHSVRRYYLERLEDNLSDQAALVRRALFPDLRAGVGPRRIHEVVRGFSTETRARITIISPTGQVLGDTKYAPGGLPNLSRRPEVAAILRGSAPQPRRFSRAVREEGMFVAVPATRQGKLLAIVRLNLELDDLEAQLRELRLLLLGVVLLTTIVAVATTLLVIRSIMEPVLEVTQAARRMAAGDLTHRVVSYSEDETGQLTRSFNAMAARIQEMMDELDRERQKMAHVFTQMTDGLVVVDADTRVLMMNPAAEHILGVSAAPSWGQPLAEVAGLPVLVQMVTEVMESHGEQQGEVVRSGPEERVIDVYATRVADQPGAPPGVMLVLHDWTEIWRTERMRRELVANASHELRTPIAAVKMMAETLLAGAAEDPEARTRFLTLMEREADRLSHLVSDLLDLSQMDAGQWPLTIEAFPLREVVDHVLQKSLVVAQERRQALRSKCPPGIAVLADRRAVLQILSNLVENAIKYTPEGGEVAVAAQVEGGYVRIDVRDTGIGVSPEHLGRIFERFYRVDKARSREQGGTGLGLAIVKHLAEALGGGVAVQSERGRGSTFTVTLPTPPPGA